jgi:hypothetical protein
MKVKLFFGKVPFSGRFYVTPTLYTTWDTSDKYAEYHRISVECALFLFGIGVLFRWKNKNCIEIPDETIKIF